MSVSEAFAMSPLPGSVLFKICYFVRKSVFPETDLICSFRFNIPVYYVSNGLYGSMH